MKMLRSETQIDTIVSKAKSYYWFINQYYVGITQSYIDTELQQTIQKKSLKLRNLIKSSEFIGISLNDRNMLAESMQGLIKDENQMLGYMVDGFVTNDYAKANKINV